MTTEVTKCDHKEQKEDRMTPKERIEEMVHQQFKYTCPHEPPKEAKECKWCRLKLDDIVTDILKAVRESLPEKHLVKGTPEERVYWESYGYNQAIEDMKERCL